MYKEWLKQAYIEGELQKKKKKKKNNNNNNNKTNKQSEVFLGSSPKSFQTLPQ